MYSLDGFKFDKDIDLAEDTEQKGVYVFTRSFRSILKDEVPNSFEIRHELLYLGMADSIETRPLSPSHTKWEYLRKDKCDRIGIYFCADDENPKNIESMILDKFSFKENIAENQDGAGKPFNVAED